MLTTRFRVPVILLCCLLGIYFTDIQETALALASTAQAQPSDAQLQQSSDAPSQTSQEIRDASQNKQWYDSSLFGVVVGAFLGTGLSTASRLVTEQQAKHKDRIHLSYQVMKEWDGLREERNSAYELFVVPYGSEPMPPFSSYQALDRVHMNKVMEFFDRLDLLNQQHLVNEELVVGYLSQDYQQWEQDYFSKQRGGLETNPIFAYGFQGPYQWLLKS